MTAPDARSFLIGVLSDTHGTLDPAVLDSFVGVDHIIHAGDVGGLEVLLELEARAPVTAVLGNTDYAHPGLALGRVERPVLAGVRFLIAHVPGDADVVVTGHTHRPTLREEGGVVHLNPGSASRPRGAQGPTVALVKIFDRCVEVRILPLLGR